MAQEIDYLFSPANHRITPAQWFEPMAWNATAKTFENKHGRRPRVLCVGQSNVLTYLFDHWKHRTMDKRIDPRNTFGDLFSLVKMTPDLDWLIPTKQITGHGQMPLDRENIPTLEALSVKIHANQWAIEDMNRFSEEVDLIIVANESISSNSSSIGNQCASAGLKYLFIKQQPQREEANV